jgi:large subunit ribosomal protein L22
MIEAQATARGVRTSAQKAGLVCELIRGKNVNQALATLQFTRKTIAREPGEGAALGGGESAAEGRLQRRHRPAVRSGVLREPGTVDEARASAPMGRAYRVAKRSAHLTVCVAERPLKIARVGYGGRCAAAKPARARKTSEEG